MQFFTLLGQPPFTVGIAAVVLGYGTALNKPLYEIAGIIALVTITLSSVLKLLLRRARPSSDYARDMLFKTFSFPSGHAAGSLVSFAMAALVIGNKWPDWIAVAWTITLVACLLIGISRVYLRAHYASDVIGGWIVGGLGLGLIIVEFL